MNNIYNILQNFQKGSIPTQENFIDAFKYLDNNQIGAVLQFLSTKNILSVNNRSYLKLNGAVANRMLYPDLTKLLTDNFTVATGDNITTLTLPTASDPAGISTYVNAGLSAITYNYTDVSLNEQVIFTSTKYQPLSIRINYKYTITNEISDIIIYQLESTLPISTNTFVTLEAQPTYPLSTFYIDYNNYRYLTDSQIKLEFSDNLPLDFANSLSTAIANQTILQINLTAVGLSLYNNKQLTAYIPSTTYTAVSSNVLILEDVTNLGSTSPDYLLNKYSGNNNVQIVSSFQFAATTLTKVGSALYIVLPDRYYTSSVNQIIIPLTYEI